MTEYRVVIPVERFRIVEFQNEDLPGIGVINESLIPFEPKVAFAWHLSLIMDFDELAGVGMPTEKEREIVDTYGDELDQAFKGDPEKPNSLFLARITWNGTRQFVYRVYDPKVVDQYLKGVIESNSNVRPFDYRMEHDPDWKLAEWHLSAGTN